MRKGKRVKRVKRGKGKKRKMEKEIRRKGKDKNKGEILG